MDKSKKAVEIFNENAIVYQEKFMDLSNYSKALTFFCENLKETQKTILEFACGPGNVTKFLLNLRPDFIIDASDLSENMLQLARLNNPTAHFELLDMRSIEEVAMNYDAVVNAFGFPYLKKEETIDFIENASKKLTKNGLLFISTMEADYSKSCYVTSSSGEHTLYTYYHQSNYLIDAMLDNNIELIYTERKNIKGSFAKDLILIGRKIVH